MTPSWIPHATINQLNHQQTDDPAVKASAQEKKVRTISDSQRRFAAQFSSPTQSGMEGPGDSQLARGNRWASKSTRSTAPSNSPGGSCDAEYGRLERNDPHTIEHRPEESDQESRQGLQKTEIPARELQSNHGSMEKIENMDWSRRKSKAGKTDSAQNGSTARCQTAGGLVKGPWTREEDQKILDCIAKNMTRWSEIAERVEGRIGKQCRERWFNHLDPTLRKSSWTPEEDEILVQGQARFGNSWTKIAKLLQGRSENAVKNRWNSAARKKGKATTQRVMSDSFKAVATNEEQRQRQIEYAMVPSAHHINSRVAPPAAGPSSGLHITPPLQRFPGGMPFDESTGFSLHQNRPNQQAEIDPSRSCSMGAPQRHARPLGPEQYGPGMDGQPCALPSAFLTPLVNLGVANDSSQHLLQPSCSAASPEGGFREEASAASAGSFQSFLHDGQPLPDTDRVFSTDELSLSNTLLSLSLDEQHANSGGLSGGRKASDQIGVKAGRVDMFNSCEVDPPLRGMGFGDGQGFQPGYLPDNGGLGGSVQTQGVLQDRYRGKGPTDSSQLLLAPAHAHTEASQAGPHDRSHLARA
ncbi:unnamed protein product [Scytosiphon promiscuus]